MHICKAKVRVSSWFSAGRYSIYHSAISIHYRVRAALELDRRCYSGLRTIVRRVHSMLCSLITICSESLPVSSDCKRKTKHVKEREEVVKAVASRERLEQYA
jgi:hypothetical protein